MSDHERAILELSAMIQPGDLLTLASGHVHRSLGTPANPSDHLMRKGLDNPLRRSLWLMGWLVAIDTGTCYMPVGLNAVHQVERGGLVIWSKDGERAPIQLSMFEDAS